MRRTAQLLKTAVPAAGLLLASLVMASSAEEICFSSLRDDGVTSEIYVMRTDGTGVTRLTDNGADDYDPAWSPDGKKIAFVSTRDGNSEIYVMEADGSDLVQMTNHPESDSEPSWSPDGRQITFTSHRDGNFEIYRTDLTGIEVRNLTNDSTGDTQPAWSPDGTSIAFVRRLRGGSVTIFLMGIDGSSPTQVGELGDRNPAWSPDGRHLAFAADQDDPDRTAFEDRSYSAIGVMTRDGADRRLITEKLTWRGEPSWSPDGSQIVFVSEEDGAPEIYIIDVDGSDQLRLTFNETGDWSPSWSPAPRASGVERAFWGLVKSKMTEKR